MLTSLQIRDFAIVDRIDVEFESGMTVLTGETGAGKSILVDALGLVLGERGSSGLVREGASRAEFSAEFNVQSLAEANTWLEEQALDSDGECLLRRAINADGRSRAFINGNAVPLQSLKTLGEMLLDIHGQHFHQSLGKAATQRDLLDHFAGNLELLGKTAGLFADWKNKSDELDALLAADADRTSRLDLLTFHCQELDALDLQPGELEQLQNDRARLMNSGRLAEGVASAMQSIYDGESANAQSLISDACQTIESLAELDQTLQPVAALLREADIQISEAADTLQRYGDSLDMDPAEHDRVEERLDAVQSLTRKHRVQAEELLSLAEELHKQLHDLQHAEETGEQLEEAVKVAETKYLAMAGKLSTRRQDAAARFSHAVTAAMADLGMGGGVFEIAVRQKPAGKPTMHGMDDIEFLISANPGQPPMPLAKIASGGELSRMSLAVQVIGSDGSRIPTMVFDEVDSGVGGGVAEMVGQRLREVSRSRQVLCVTHLPQVASLANNHFRVSKISDDQTTRTGIQALSADARVDELARMLGGVEITDRTRDHAAEMLQTASAYSGNEATNIKSA